MQATTLSLTSLYDPGYGGHQPRGFDQIMLFYNYYKVLAVKYVYRVYNTTTGPNAFEVFVRPRAFTAPAVVTTDILGYCEDGSKLLRRRSMTESSTVVMRGLLRSWVVEGDTKQMFASDIQGYVGNVGASPTLGTFCLFGVANFEPAASLACTCRIDVMYYAMFWTVKSPTSS